MAESIAPAPSNAPPDLVGARRRCDALCDEFEQAWQSGERPRVEAFAARVPVSERAKLLRELVALDCAYRREAGEQPQPADYEVAAGEFLSIINEALSTRLRHNSTTGRFDRGALSTVPDHAAEPEKKREQIGDYKILSEIARGGMGVVYKARHQTLDRTAAVKLIRGGDQAGEEELKRFQIEASAAAQLDHPAIVPVFELGQHDGQPFLAMAFVEGTSLWTRIKDTPFDARFAATIMQRVAEGVQYAHERGIIHRDLKPQNILLAAGDQPRITDFGLAKHHTGDSSLTATGQILGTPSYMPPEQASGKDREVGPLADVYSLGATLYCLLVGHPPFRAAQPVETLRQVIEQEPVPPRAIDRGIPRDLETICLKCLQKSPAKRYPSAGELAADLQRFLRGEPIQARAIGLVERAGRWCARNRVVAGLGSTAIILLATVAGVSTWASFRQAALALEKNNLNIKQNKLILEKDGLVNEQKKLIAEKDQLAAGERKQRLAAESELYNSQIARSHAEIERGNLISASVALNTMAFPLRNWEHRYLTRRAQGTPFQLEGHAGQYRNVAFSPDGQWIAAGGQDRIVHLWDANTGRHVKQLLGHPTTIGGVAFSPDGQRLATLGMEGSLILWDMQTTEPIHRMQIPQPPHWTVEYDPTGKLLATGSQDGMVRLWDCETGAERLKFRAANGQARGLSFHPDGSRLAVALWCHPRIGELKVFDTAAGKELFAMDGNGTYCQVIRHSPDGRYLATSTALGVQLWDAATGAKVRHWGYQGDRCEDLKFSPDGALLVGGSNDKSVRVFDVREGKELGIYRGHQFSVHGVDISPDGSRVVSVSVEDFNSEIKVWNITEPPGDQFLRGHTDRPNFVVFNPQGTLLATGSNDRTVKIWDVRTWRVLHTLRGHGFSLWGIEFDHSGTRLISWSFDAQRKPELFLWNVADGKKLGEIRGRHTDWIMEATFSPDDQFIATASKDGTAKIWDAATLQEVTTLTGHTGEVHGVSFHPTDNLLLTLSNGDDRTGKSGEAISWRVPTWERIEVREQSATRDAPGMFSPDGRWILGRGRTGEVIVRNPDDGKIKWTLRGHNEQLSGSVANYDGSRLFTASYDHTLKVWDLKDGKEVFSLSLGSDVSLIPTNTAVHPGDQLVVQGLSDHTVRLLDATLDEEECWLRGHNGPIALMGVTDKGRLVTQEVEGRALGRKLVWDVSTGRRLEEAIPEVQFERVKVIGGLELRWGNTVIDICPSDNQVARLRRRRTPPDRDDLWKIDAIRREASALARHRAGAAAAEKADDSFAAAVHWNWLKSLEPAGSDAAAKYDAAVEQLKERKLPVPRP